MMPQDAAHSTHTLTMVQVAPATAAAYIISAPHVEFWRVMGKTMKVEKDIADAHLSMFICMEETLIHDDGN